MLPLKHILFGAIFSIIVFLLIPQIQIIGTVIIFLSTFLIDFDHYFYYMFRKKDANPFNSYKWHVENRKKFYSLSLNQRKEIYGGLYIFHGFELLIILFFLGFFIYKPILLFFVGFLFHMLIDWYEEIMLDCRPIKLFLILDFLESKKLKHIEDM